MSLRKRKVSNVASRTGKKDPASSRKFSCSHTIEEWFLYRNVALYYLSEDFGRSTNVSAIAKEKKQVKYRAGGAWKCPHFRNSKSP